MRSRCYRMLVRDMEMDPLVIVNEGDNVRTVVTSMGSSDCVRAMVIEQSGRQKGIVELSELVYALSNGSVSWDSSMNKVRLSEALVLRPDQVVDEDILVGHKCFLVEEESGRPTGLVEREKAIAQLYRLRTLYLESVIEQLPTAVIGVDANLDIVLFNHTAERLTTIARETVFGKTVKELIPGSRLPEVVSSGQTEFAERVRIYNSTLNTNRFPIKYQGKIIGAAAVLNDISTIENASLRLDKIEGLNKHLNSIIERSADGLVVSDENGVLIRINKAYEQIVGIKAEDYLNKSVVELKANGVLPEVVTLKVLESGKQENLYLKLRGREVLLTGQPIFDDGGKLIRVVATIRDLTELSELKEQIQTFKELNDRYRAELAEFRAKETQTDIVAESPAMRRIVDLCRRVGQVESNVLITGESGTGKELVAKLIHKASSRADGAFIGINCGAIPTQLLESELFGYEEGAFTGAKRSGKLGLFETARGGTIFLDEIAEMPLELQVKLLRVIQERCYYRVGGNKSIALNARIIAATNKRLSEKVAEGLFREDLFYRLNVIEIAIPPLRDRKEDIPSLAMFFLERFNKKYCFRKRLNHETLAYFMSYNWPGNVRELENTMEKLVVLSNGDDLDITLVYRGNVVAWARKSLKAAVEETERQMLLAAYQRLRSTREVAKELGLSQASVVRKLQKYEVSINT